MRCPICSTMNDDKAQECIACGYVFFEEEETPASWVLESASLDDSDVDGYGQSVSEKQKEQTDTEPQQAGAIREERIEQEDGTQVSVITITVPSVEKTTADTDYELHTDALMADLPQKEAEEKEKVSKRVAKAIKAPLTARETALLISVAVMAILLLGVVGYFLLSGKLAESIHNFTTPSAAEETAEPAESQTAPQETEPAESESAQETEPVTETPEESTVETEAETEETSEPETEKEPEVLIEDGVAFYDNRMIFVEAEGGYALMSYTGTEEIAVVPEEIQGTPVVEILERAFADRADITQIQIPEGVRRIDSFAFLGCSSLQVLAFPATLEEIGNSAFDYTGPFVVISPAGTYAQQYCQLMSIPWADGDGLLEDGELPEAAVIGQEQPAAEEPAAEETSAAEPEETPSESISEETQPETTEQ